ncbi:MAG: deoxyguanosinetriphosphate triphosphohydrolase [Bifidobacteriaceae bacterium]|nr:deoxyguanosinetriphosphate triphosphohydrolase [Bifidobacteriaceae bacterium]
MSEGVRMDTVLQSSERSYCAFDEERWVQEPPKSRSRTAFERDRARLIHSSALRRLGEKSQILVAGTDDFARTRLTHTLEVAQIGRELGAVLGCDPDVVDCACLAHDLGHPPFGHNGEKVLANIASSIGGFEGNAQTLRLLTRLEPKIFRENGQSAGVNLTRASLDAAVKYPWSYEEAKARSQSENSVKFGVYADDIEVFRWLKKDAPAGKKPIECQVMDLSDDIAYSVHDMEDAVATGALDPRKLSDPLVIDNMVEATQQWYGEKWDAQKLLDAIMRLQHENMLPQHFDGSRHDLASLKNLTSELIGRFAGSVESATRDTYGRGALIRYNASLVIPESTLYEIVALKGMAVYFVMDPRESEPSYNEERKIVADLVEVFYANNPNPSDDLEQSFMQDWFDAADDNARLRVAIDQVASLTDASALSLHAIMCK